MERLLHYFFLYGLFTTWMRHLGSVEGGVAT
jgi:hypothetical protein